MSQSRDEIIAELCRKRIVELSEKIGRVKNSRKLSEEQGVLESFRGTFLGGGYNINISGKMDELCQFVAKNEHALSSIVRQTLHTYYPELIDSPIYQANKILVMLEEYSSHLVAALNKEKMKIFHHTDITLTDLHLKKNPSLNELYWKINVTNGLMRELNELNGASENERNFQVIIDFVDLNKDILNKRRFHGISGAFWKLIDGLRSIVGKGMTTMGVDGAKVIKQIKERSKFFPQKEASDKKAATDISEERLGHKK